MKLLLLFAIIAVASANNFLDSRLARLNYLQNEAEAQFLR